MDVTAQGSDFVPFALPDVGEEEIEAVVLAMRSGWLTTGPNAAALEDEFARYFGAGLHAVAVNSATAGLHLALEAAGVGPGDEVLVPAWTFTASAEVVRYVGADPIFVDVDPVTLNLDLAAAATAVGPRTRAVIPVHFAGYPVPREGLGNLAAKHGLIVVEDAAHALGTWSEGAPIGSGSSEATVFSFYATKTITTGEGGMVVTSSEVLANRARTMRLHGISRDVFDRYRSATPSWRYEVVAPGFKYNLTDTAAAMGRVQLRRCDAMRTRRERIAERYFAGLSDLPLELPQQVLGGDVHAWHLYVLRIRADSPIGRDRFIDRMAQEGVGCSVHFIPLHMHPYWRETYSLRESDYPVATREFARVVSLPIFSGMTDDQVTRVVETAHKVFE